MRQLFITELGLARRIVRIFESRVNSSLSAGWKCVGEPKIEKRGLRIICTALLEKPCSEAK